MLLHGMLCLCLQCSHGLENEQSPSPARTRPAEADDGDVTGGAASSTSAMEQASSSNVTNRQFGELAFRDQYSGYSEGFGGGQRGQERPQSYSGAEGTGPESGCWNCGGDGPYILYDDFMMTCDMASNFKNLQGLLHAK